ncbi:hypothetical protein [Mycobacterium sp. AT1]|uniref:hypothetical protein n=1 Tax=Mycobacterium sp. AT1 TaxID=1961706 RepID=UPI0009ABE0BF|nr:hypothetical protein [Mycobacterium sp. AT1]OPX12487.1 hypothetical protein B1790_03290 [Mycobacterium sp. AT1]
MEITNLGGPDWRVHPENNAVATMPVVSLGNGTQRVKPTTVSVVTPPATTGAPGWRPSRAD